MIALALLLGAAPVSEEAAYKLVEQAMRGIDAKGARKGCLAYTGDETTSDYYEIAVLEVHDRTCGGLEGVMPTRDRFRVGRRASWLQRYQLVEDRWRPCRLRPGRPPSCPAN